MRIVTVFFTLLVAAGVVSCSPDGSGSARTPGAAAPGQSTETQPLLFGIGMHIEPLGATAQMGSQPAAAGGDYNNAATFAKGVESIQAVVDIVQAHDGRLTIQAQSPFTTTAIKTDSTVLSDWEDAGNEVGLHFHEDAHLGKGGNTLPAGRWCEAMREEVDLLHEAGVDVVDYWSGGNLYPQLFEAAACAGLSVNGDWKNPSTQETPSELLGASPWRPSGGTDGLDVAVFAGHDPEGAVVFVPDGRSERGNFPSAARDEGGEAYFAYLEESLLAAIQGVEPGGVNVFHFTIHPGEFRGDPADQFAIIDRFLAEVVDPLVAAGEVRWATLSEMAAAFEEWEADHPGEDPRAGAADVAGGATATPAAPTTGPGANAGATRPAAPGGGSTGRVQRDVTYCTKDGVDLKMDIYRPEAANGAAVMFIHGGGWTSGSKSGGSGSEMFGELVARGYVVASVDYRLAPEYRFPAQIQDVTCAVLYLKRSAGDLGINPARIGVYGGSAGGHLAALLGTTGGHGYEEGIGSLNAEVAAVVDLFGPTDLTRDFAGASQAIITSVFGTSDRGGKVLKQASPVYQASADDPPFLIIHGEADSLVPIAQSEALYRALVAAGVPAELVRVANAGHGFVPSGGPISPDRVEIAEMVADFFDEQMNNE